MVHSAAATPVRPQQSVEVIPSGIVGFLLAAVAAAVLMAVGAALFAVQVRSRLDNSSIPAMPLLPQQCCGVCTPVANSHSRHVCIAAGLVWCNDSVIGFG